MEWRSALAAQFLDHGGSGLESRVARLPIIHQNASACAEVILARSRLHMRFGTAHSGNLLELQSTRARVTTWWLLGAELAGYRRRTFFANMRAVRHGF